MSNLEILGAELVTPHIGTMGELTVTTGEQTQPEEPTANETDLLDSSEYDAAAAFNGFIPKPIEPSGDEIRIMQNEVLSPTPTQRALMYRKEYLQGQEAAKQSPELPPVPANKIAKFITTSNTTVSAVPVEVAPDWQDKGNCKGVDPVCFFLSVVQAPVKPKKSAQAARFATTVLSTHSRIVKSMVSGAV